MLLNLQRTHLEKCHKIDMKVKMFLNLNKTMSLIHQAGLTLLQVLFPEYAVIVSSFSISIEHGKKIYEKLRRDSDKTVYYVDGGIDQDIREEHKKENGGR